MQEIFFGVSPLSQHLTNAFSFVWTKFRKGRDIHIKEIQAFMCNFETLYRPDDLSRTIHKATTILREKLLAKLHDLKISYYVEDKYKFSLNFHPPKFLHFLNSGLFLAFRPPFPWWFVFGSHLSVIKNECLKPVTPSVPK